MFGAGVYEDFIKKYDDTDARKTYRGYMSTVFGLAKDARQNPSKDPQFKDFDERVLGQAAGIKAAADARKRKHKTR